jgi:cytochrome c oxidase cbb3-type subunit 4
MDPDIESYSILRQFADSWMLLFMFVFFVGLVIWVIFGKRSKFQDTANVIFRNEDKPAERPHHVPGEDGGKETRK